MNAKKLKLIVKGEKKPTFGTDPNEPWSVRAGITESEKGMLHDYLKSRGINPDFVSKDTKISHAKSHEFHKWKRDHMFDDPINYVSTTAADKMKKLRSQTEETKIEEMKTLKLTPVEMRQKALNRSRRLTSVISHNGLHKEGFDDHEEIAKELIRRHGMNITRDHLKALENERDSRGALDHQAVMDKVRAMGAMTEAKTIQGTALDKFRQAAAEREKKHAEIEKQSKEKPDMKGAIDRLEKHLNKEEASITNIKHNGKTIGVIRHDGMGEYTGSHWDSKQNWSSRDRKELVSHIKQYHQRHLNKEATDPGVSKTKETQFHKKLDTLVHSTFGKRKDEMKKEEVEQIDEISKSTLASYKDKSTASLKNAQTNRDAAEAGKHMSKGFADLHAKSDATAKKRVKGLIGYMQRKQGMKPTSEDVFQDTQAATQTAFDMGTQADDREPVYSKKREMSKSARIIKALYKKHKMVKEEIYDHEKEDKSVATYGKKPKVDKQEVYDDEAQAAMVLKGGKTLTGQTRDTLEIDPIMRKANNNNN